MIDFQCPECKSSFRTKDEFAGKKAKCRNCGSLILIPEIEASDAIAVEAVSEGHSRPQRDDEDWDEEERPRRRKDRTPDDGGISTLIPYTNPKALFSYYLGVFGLIPILGFFLAVGAVILGMMGLRYVKEHPTAKGTGHAIVGLVLGSISILYHLSCIGLMVVGIFSANKR
jgi:predicted Zn finger-like uncharacterized protein